MDKIIAMMVGRSLNQRFPDKENKPGEVILEVRNLTSLRQPSIRDVSFDLHKGRSLASQGWWALSAPISWKPCLVSVRKPKAPLRCTVRRSTTTTPTKPLIMALRW
ncbi:hypothetical protein EIN43_25325 [Enterobacter hormaechei]|uniref:Uncharacterized protein n=1 Tax=Enterobacter hormaechei TaxID=158836 RepID=A0A4Y5ZPN9_9ENTR|nr:hypothetical protein EIN43_25325 [Enterobacter hormaechei]